MMKIQEVILRAMAKKIREEAVGPATEANVLSSLPSTSVVASLRLTLKRVPY
jgi:hypothetical protein